MAPMNTLLLIVKRSLFSINMVKLFAINILSPLVVSSLIWFYIIFHQLQTIRHSSNRVIDSVLFERNNLSKEGTERIWSYKILRLIYAELLFNCRQTIPTNTLYADVKCAFQFRVFTPGQVQVCNLNPNLEIRVPKRPLSRVLENIH